MDCLTSSMNIRSDATATAAAAYWKKQWSRRYNFLFLVTLVFFCSIIGYIVVDKYDILNYFDLMDGTSTGAGTKKKKQNESNTDISTSTSKSASTPDKEESLSSSSSLSILQMKRKHPMCFSKELFFNNNDHYQRHYKNGFKLKKLRDIGKWKKIGNNVKKSKRYNHLCPFILPRYNCAKNTTQRYEDVPTDWKLVLHNNNNPPLDDNNDDNNNNQHCNLWEFASDLGGPVGLAKYLLMKKKKNINNNSTTTTKNKNSNNSEMITILIYGDSYLRQILEALICGYQHDISNVLLQKNSKYEISMAALKKRNGTKITLSEVGTFDRPYYPPPYDGRGSVRATTDDEEEEGGEESKCRPATRNSKFYEYGVQLPIVCSSSKYDDNIAMVEFGGRIRFYYVFRPSYYQNLTEVYDVKLNLDLDPNDVDMLIFNDEKYQSNFHKEQKGPYDIFQKNGIWNSSNTNVLWPSMNAYEESQIRDIVPHGWFGADNPWITNPPDSHACMPGVPDDEVNLLLFLAFFLTG